MTDSGADEDTVENQLSKMIQSATMDDAARLAHLAMLRGHLRSNTLGMAGGTLVRIAISLIGIVVMIVGVVGFTSLRGQPHQTASAAEMAKMVWNAPSPGKAKTLKTSVQFMSPLTGEDLVLLAATTRLTENDGSTQEATIVTNIEGIVVARMVEIDGEQWLDADGKVLPLSGPVAIQPNIALAMFAAESVSQQNLATLGDYIDSEFADQYEEAGKLYVTLRIDPFMSEDDVAAFTEQVPGSETVMLRLVGDLETNEISQWAVTVGSSDADQVHLYGVEVIEAGEYPIDEVDHTVFDIDSPVTTIR